MTALEHDGWGMAVGYYDYYETTGILPYHPAVTAWQNSIENEMMAYRVRCFYENTDADEVGRIRLQLDEGGEAYNDALALTTGNGEWDKDYDVASVAVPYPNPAAAEHVSGYPPAQIMPYTKATIRVSASTPGYLTVYGVELSAVHDAAYTGRDMELFDYSGGSFVANYEPGSSFILTRMVAEAQNRILYSAGFQIGCAVAGPAAAR